jgi:hypothetical protein
VLDLVAGPGLHGRRDHRGGRGPSTATPARPAVTRWSPPAGSRWATSSSSARKYAEALDLKVLDEHGKQRTVVMGSYGVGVSRAVACIAEGNHDDLGLVWPRDISPADVHIVATGKDESATPRSSRRPSD